MGVGGGYGHGATDGGVDVDGAVGCFEGKRGRVVRAGDNSVGGDER